MIRYHARSSLFSRLCAWATLAVAASFPAVAATGCSVEVSSGGNNAVEGCKVGGTVHPYGSSFPDEDGCNTCSCEKDGSVVCTLIACGETCTHEGKTYVEGESFPAGDGCNTCTCEEDGSVSCTLALCAPTCTYDGESYAAGESFTSIDGCNVCHCMADGHVACLTLAICPVTCIYDGQSYPAGKPFPASDGCNTCTCSEDGSVACTKLACACDPASEWWRDYVTEDPMECQVIFYGCPGETTHFQNACGCGCEQDPSCPESVNCMPPKQCDLEAFGAKCPYSMILF